MTQEELVADWVRFYRWFNCNLPSGVSRDNAEAYMNKVALIPNSRVPSAEYNPFNQALILCWSFTDIEGKYLDVAFFPDGKAGFYYRDGERIMSCGYFDDDYAEAKDIPVLFVENFI